MFVELCLSSANHTGVPDPGAIGPNKVELLDVTLVCDDD